MRESGASSADVPEGAANAAGPGARRGLRAALLASVPVVAGLPALVGWPAFAETEWRLRLATAAGDVASVTGADVVGPMSLALLGLATFAVTLSIQHLRSRRLWNLRDEAQTGALETVRAQLERATTFLAAEPHFTIAFDGRNGEPEFEGDPGLLLEGAPPARVLSFGNWLSPEEAAALDKAVGGLRQSGQKFRLTLRSKTRGFVEAVGQPVAGRAVLRLRRVTGERLEIARLDERLVALYSEAEALKALLDAVSQPAWLRDDKGKLAWVNAAYVSAVEAKDRDDAVGRGLELLETRTRATIADQRSAGEVFRGRVQAVLAGHRRMLDVVDVGGPAGSSGIALDVSDLEAARRDLERQRDAHVRTLNELPTAVAIFDRRHRLEFFNSAFAELWQLDLRYLNARPDLPDLLERLRADGKLLEETDFRSWKAELLGHFQSNETNESGWHLPQGRALRVVVSPNPQGGVTFLFDDVTAQHNLETNYNRLETMQGETLMALTEGVAVFGASGRLQLSNPAFAELLAIDPALLEEKPHVDAIVAAVSKGLAQNWADIRAEVCGMQDSRIGGAFRGTDAGGRTLASITTPLPEGATLVTLVDITAAVEVERALRERNEALERAGDMRNDLVKSLSFELRAPLMSVVGIAQLLASGATGRLNDGQRGYAQDLMQASNAVLALFNDILDLTDLETGAVDLAPEPVDLGRLIAEASEGLQDRLGDAKVKLAVAVAPDLGRLRVDRRRLRQTLYNLIANAVAFSEPGDEVRLTAARNSAQVIIEAHDAGRGVEGLGDLRGAEADERRDRGQGLRLSICRSLVELHGGTLTVEHPPGGGRLVRLTLPARSEEGPPAVLASRSAG